MMITCILQVQGRDYLEFKPGNAASVSVQSTSLKEQHHKQIVTRLYFL